MVKFKLIPEVNNNNKIIYYFQLPCVPKFFILKQNIIIILFNSIVLIKLKGYIKSNLTLRI